MSVHLRRTRSWDPASVMIVHLNVNWDLELLKGTAMEGLNFPVLIVGRVSVMYHSLKDTSVFTQERNLMTALSVGGVSYC
ncbi:UNVERIFIED_CONTAM: hypothetical protein FKN15_007801 [Acipenser sinensis]